MIRFESNPRGRFTNVLTAAGSVFIELSRGGATTTTVDNISIKRAIEVA